MAIWSGFRIFEKFQKKKIKKFLSHIPNPILSESNLTSGLSSSSISSSSLFHPKQLEHQSKIIFYNFIFSIDFKIRNILQIKSFELHLNIIQ